MTSGKCSRLELELELESVLELVLETEQGNSAWKCVILSIPQLCMHPSRNPNPDPNPNLPRGGPGPAGIRLEYAVQGGKVLYPSRPRVRVSVRLRNL